MKRHPILQHLSSCIGAAVLTVASAWVFLASTAWVPPV